MSDLSLHKLLQAGRGPSISSTELEAFGKKASELWSSSDVSLSGAVVETVKQAGLSAEQVRRVIEFANTSAYLNEFHKEGSPHRVVEFHGGPADPAVVLQELNSTGEKTAVDHGSLDYGRPPERPKLASAREELAFEQIFEARAPNLPEENPLGDIIDLREKVASLHDHLTSEISGLEVMHIDLCDRLFEQVKQAALEGHSMGEIVQVWSKAVGEPVFFKTAFDMLSPRLVQNEVFQSQVDIADSLEKVGAPKMVNLNHPLISDFQEYCETLSKLASLRDQQQQAADALKETTEFILHPEKTASFPPSSSGTQQSEELKQAAVGGVVGQILSGAKKLAPYGEAAGKAVGHVIGGPEAASVVGKGVGKAVQYAPHAIGAALALRAAQHLQAAGNSPTGQAIKSFIPGTQANQQKKYELQMQYGGMPYGTY